jgi:hypothetical protein
VIEAEWAWCQLMESAGVGCCLGAMFYQLTARPIAQYVGGAVDNAGTSVFSDCTFSGNTAAHEVTCRGGR